ncbi:MAG: SHOCT domain-containing protein [Chloroflexi bacterium]|nr:SHOCT domain-containing protein [Chloroflexota bacterium]
MAIVPLHFVVPAALSAGRMGRTGTPDPAGPVRPTAADRGASVDARAGAGVEWSADPRGAEAGAWTGAGDDDLASSLERLAALHASGALTDDEFARAKEAVLGAGEGRRP